MTKPIIVVKMFCDLLYIIQVKGFLKVLPSWPYTYHLIVTMLDLALFLARLFLFSISIT